MTQAAYAAQTERVIELTAELSRVDTTFLETILRTTQPKINYLHKLLNICTNPKQMKLKPWLLV